MEYAIIAIVIIAAAYFVTRKKKTGAGPGREDIGNEQQK